MNDEIQDLSTWLKNLTYIQGEVVENNGSIYLKLAKIKTDMDHGEDEFYLIQLYKNQISN